MEGFESSIFQGRITPIGWLAIMHIDRMSRILTDADSDNAGLDIEVMFLYGLVVEKLETSTRKKKDFEEEWAATEQEIMELAEQGAGEADRLSVRMHQFRLLCGALTRSGVLDSVQLEKDEWRP